MSQPLTFEYVLLEAESPGVLKRQVHAHHAAGYKLQGGVSVSVYYNKDGLLQQWCAQAMVLETWISDNGNEI